MKTLDRSRQDDSFERVLRERLDGLASAYAAREPGEFMPDAVRLVTEEASPPRRTTLLLGVAAAIGLVIAGLLVVAGRDTGSAPADREEVPADAPAPASSFETPTVRLAADSVEVVTEAGTFVPTADVVVTGDPGMPDEYTSIELRWLEGGAEQRIHMHFASDGVSWWADEIRVYDGTSRSEWVEPAMTGRFFETPLGEPYRGEVGLVNLRISGMTLQAFLPPSVCEGPAAPIALVSDYPSIDGSAGEGFGASFQVYDTATCRPLPIADFSFAYLIDDPAVATVVDLEVPGASRLSPVETTLPGAESNLVVDDSVPGVGRSFDEIKTRVDLQFHDVGTTSLQVTVTDADGSLVDTVDVPIVVAA